MPVNPAAGVGILLVQTLFHLATFILVLRFLLHFSNADYYNPITQSLVKVTNPLVRPLQGILRPMGRFDLATLILALVVKLVAMLILLSMAGYGMAPIPNMLFGALGALVSVILDIYFFALIISIILSWIAPNANHPGALLVYQLTEPVMAPIRRVLPSLGGLDLSPIFLFLGISILEMLLIGTLVQLAGMPVAMVMGV
ncbi:YggT family protein [Allopseudospirillum japonicum]|uniref:YggT family protein n=1 Tax=Allopseudospirillum japonicum TaxID=64971 RepID=A0A1H6QVR0_9GAMM|nr:YggT family protein [Allopseudospirillum japonicum]SEI47643.1 YggT family protein [Allopseudospirillum japonicum]